MNNQGSVGQHNNKDTYWKTFLGLPLYKIDWYFKYFLYRFLGITLGKCQDQKKYWNTRGVTYFQEVFDTRHYDYEIFFQDMLIDELKQKNFRSFFEAGSGFGWNVKRVKKEFPAARITGVDFSLPQLLNSRKYLPEINMPAVQGDACRLPFKDKSFDIGFSLGVFMNIHPRIISEAIDEMIRVSKKYIIHLEWDQNNTKPQLRDRRVFKTNIISHDYRKLYKDRKKKIIKFKTYKDFEFDFNKRFPETTLSSWEQFEGPEKYIFIVIEI